MATGRVTIPAGYMGKRFVNGHGHANSGRNGAGKWIVSGSELWEMDSKGHEVRAKVARIELTIAQVLAGALDNLDSTGVVIVPIGKRGPKGSVKMTGAEIIAAAKAQAKAQAKAHPANAAEGSAKGSVKVPATVPATSNGTATV